MFALRTRISQSVQWVVRRALQLARGCETDARKRNTEVTDQSEFKLRMAFRALNEAAYEAAAAAKKTRLHAAALNIAHKVDDLVESLPPEQRQYDTEAEQWVQGMSYEEFIAEKLKDPTWAPYCLVCDTMWRMTKTDYGFRCDGFGDGFARRGCGNKIGFDMKRYQPKGSVDERQ